MDIDDEYMSDDGSMKRSTYTTLVVDDEDT
jgi:hypothetical protein